MGFAKTSKHVGFPAAKPSGIIPDCPEFQALSQALARIQTLVLGAHSAMLDHPDRHHDRLERVADLSRKYRLRIHVTRNDHHHSLQPHCDDVLRPAVPQGAAEHPERPPRPSEWQFG